jgi:uncharacterized protein YceH (UPF0502 family)
MNTKKKMKIIAILVVASAFLVELEARPGKLGSFAAGVAGGAVGTAVVNSFRPRDKTVVVEKVEKETEEVAELKKEIRELERELRQVSRECRAK